MKNTTFISIWLLLFSMFFLTCQWELETVDPCPVVTKIEPLNARAGDELTILGNHLGSFQKSRDEILIGGIAAELKGTVSDSEIKAIVPGNINTAEAGIVVVIDACRSNEKVEEPKLIYDQVSLSSIAPTEAAHGEEVMISGSNFRTGDVAAHEVLFVDVPGIVKSVPSDELLVVEVPLGAKTGEVHVRVDGFEAVGPEFTYILTATVSLLAGSFGTAGQQDGFGPSARFDTPSGLDVDAMGNIYVADKGNHVIRKISSGGNTTLFAGKFDTPDHVNHPSNGLNARFNVPQDLAIDQDGNIYVAESENRTIRRIAANSSVITIAGDHSSGPGFEDNTQGALARFWFPRGVAVDQSGILYVSDRVDQRIRKIDTNLDLVTTLAGAGLTSPGSSDGSGMSVKFNSPTGLAFDPTAALIYVADFNNQRIRSISTFGESNTVAGSVEGHAPGIGTNAKFDHPGDVALDGQGNVYVADTDNHRIRRIDKNTLAVTDIAGIGTIGQGNGPGGNASFNFPEGIAFDIPRNIIYIADTRNHVIRKIALE